ncbi:hypothetical protein MPTK2_3g05050 [Marchantia polymorpha subsp. ruderalis]
MLQDLVFGSPSCVIACPVATMCGRDCFVCNFADLEDCEPGKAGIQETRAVSGSVASYESPRDLR